MDRTLLLSATVGNCDKLALMTNPIYDSSGIAAPTTAQRIIIHNNPVVDDNTMIATSLHMDITLFG